MKRRDNIKNIIDKFVKEEEFSGTILVKEGKENIYREKDLYSENSYYRRQ